MKQGNGLYKLLMLIVILIFLGFGFQQNWFSDIFSFNLPGYGASQDVVYIIENGPTPAADGYMHYPMNWPQ